MENTSGGGAGGTIILLVLLGALGYFKYDGLDGALATILYGILFIAIFSLMGLIPLVGQIVYCIAGYFWLSPLVLGFIGIEPSWVTAIIFWLGLGYSLVFSIFILIAFFGD